MKSYKDLVADSLQHINEIFPWDIEDEIKKNPDILLIDINEPYEYSLAHIPKSINVPRGILESACDYNYDETVPELASGRDKTIIVICRSGNRSALATMTMKNMGFNNIRSLKTGLRGWNDNESPLEDSEHNIVDPDFAEDYFISKLREDQKEPK
jgi:rhodanese-related sulfurtransferase